jgi:hypothetical protein
MHKVHQKKLMVKIFSFIILFWIQLKKDKVDSPSFSDPDLFGVLAPYGEWFAYYKDLKRIILFYMFPDRDSCVIGGPKNATCPMGKIVYIYFTFFPFPLAK